MLETTVAQLINDLPNAIAPCFTEHEALHVTQADGNDFVILSASDWRAIEETIYLNRIPDMAESIKAAAAEPLEQGTRLEELDW